MSISRAERSVLFFREISLADLALVGGKNASLGEMVQHLSNKGITVPDGFAITAHAYRAFLKGAGLEKEIKRILQGLNTRNIRKLNEVGHAIRSLILGASFPQALEDAILAAYRELSKSTHRRDVDVAVRSSATAEDLPDASFAGQQETYLNIRGGVHLLDAAKKCMASLFTDRAISYRQEKNFDHFSIALSVGVQQMVRSDLGCSGVMFSLDTESGFRDVVIINAAYGLGENVVKGVVNPDEYIVFKPTLAEGFRPIISKTLGSKKKKLVYSVGGNQTTQNIDVMMKDQQRFVLSDGDVLTLAKWAAIIEEYYKRPMDMEWAKDGQSGKLTIVQARPETIHSVKDSKVLEEYVLEEKGKVIVEGQSIGSKIGAGPVHVIPDVSRIDEFKDGEVLVTEMTDPDWEPIMKMAAAIVTNSGGRTCFTGETRVLTNQGFFTMEELSRLPTVSSLRIFCFDPKTKKNVWRRLLAVMEKEGEPIRVGVSQTGKSSFNTMGVTIDHRFYVLENRSIQKKEIWNILRNDQSILVGDQLPQVERNIVEADLAYLLGGLSTDGSVYLNQRHGEVSFIQKAIVVKRDFIEEMNRCLLTSFGKTFRETIKKPSNGMIRGKPAVGTANAYRCYSKSIALKVREYQQHIPTMMLTCSEHVLWRFLAGVADGDGSMNLAKTRLNLYISKRFLLEGVVIACLRLGIVPQMTPNRTICNIQIVERLEELDRYTKRLKGLRSRTGVGTAFFSARSLFNDRWPELNQGGQMRLLTSKNLLLDKKKIKPYFQFVQSEDVRDELEGLLDAELREQRVSYCGDLERQRVYNLTVDDVHNYFVFTKGYTPVLVANCHAAIISRELGIPCVVGTRTGTEAIKSRQPVTVSCAEGEVGRIYAGQLKFRVKTTHLNELKPPPTNIMMNVGDPEAAFSERFIPNAGVGLAREEFIISNYINIHPLALIHFSRIRDPQIREEIERLTAAYSSKTAFYVDRLAEGIGRIAAAFHPKDVIVRLSDFKTNEYAHLLGGKQFEPVEANPMIGWRGASRYYDPAFRPAFELECKALKKARDVFGLKNIKIMVPFCRTVEEGKKVLAIMAEQGLKRGVGGLEVYVMCEIPSNVILAKDFAQIFDGFSIGSNDLTQLALGVDRDSSLVSAIYDERNAAVKELIREVISQAHFYHRKIGICGQAPSDFPDFAEFLIDEGIDSISLNPDSVIKTMVALAKKR